MALSAYTDGNRFLDEDKLAFADAAAYLDDVTSADRLIRAALVQVFGNDVIDLWVDPATTPDIVTDISGMLAASYLYRRIYSEETTGTPLYADELEARAMALLDKLRSGELGLDDSVSVASNRLAQLDFWPNDTTVDIQGNPIRLFSMEDVY